MTCVLIVDTYGGPYHSIKFLYKNISCTFLFLEGDFYKMILFCCCLGILLLNLAEKDLSLLQIDLPKHGTAIYPKETLWFCKLIKFKNKINYQKLICFSQVRDLLLA